MEKLIEALDANQIDSLMKFVRSWSGFYGDRKRDTRNALMVFLMLDAGLRVGELVQLQIMDLTFNGEPVTELELRGEITKNHKTRLIPLSDNITTYVDKMIRHVWPDYAPTPANFAFYTKHSMRHLTTRQVQRMLAQISSIALGKSIHPHILRHTFATRLMRKTDIRTVQMLLGHSSLTSTEIYTHPNNIDLRMAINASTEKGAS